MATYYVDGAVGNDSNLGTSEGSGNAWATINKAATTAAAGDTVNIKASATYTLTSAQTFTNSGNATSGPIIYRGYTTTPGADDGRPLITSATNSVHLFNIGAKTGLKFQHLKFTHTAATRGHGIVSATSGNAFDIAVIDCEFDGVQDAINGDNVVSFLINTIVVDRCKIRANRHGTYNAGSTLIRNSLIYECGTNGIYTTVGQNQAVIQIVDSVIRDCSVGINYSPSIGSILSLDHTVIYSNSSHGIEKNSNVIATFALCNCILYGNGGWGITVASGQLVEAENCANAYGSNTSGNRNGWSAGAGDVALSANPFTAPGSDDFSLNNTAGGGAALRNAGFPGVSHFGTGYADIGPLRHQDAGGGSGIGVLVGGGIAR
jgi:hypothetical protein